MPSNIQNLIQTMFGIQDLKLRREAADLARKQFGLSERLGDTSIQDSGMNRLRTLMELVRNLPEARAMLPHVNEFAGRTDTSPEALGALLQNVAPTQETATTTAQRPGNELVALLDSLGLEFLRTAPEAVRQGLGQQRAQKVGTGTSATEGVIDRTGATHFADSPSMSERAARAMFGMDLTAPQEAQLEQSYAGLRQTGRIQEMGLAIERARLMQGLQAAQGGADPAAFKEANDLLVKRDQLLQQMMRGSRTLTPEGRATLNAQINAYNQQLRTIAPQIFGPTGTTPLVDLESKQTIGTVNPFSAFWSTLTNR